MSGVCICRHCKCTETNACILANGDPCCWVDVERTVCSNPSCIRAEARRVRAEEKAAKRKHGDRFVGMGFGAICEEMQRDDRRKRRKRRAA